MAPQESLSIGVDVLAISLSAHNRLREIGVVHVGDLVQRTDKDLLYIKGFGKTSLKRVKIALSGLGLELGMTISGWPKRPIDG
ncbi:MAG: DNA-directed RNA polymerase subunit alpha C-terminal domain-containing protein [Rhodospirillaceae bacterium]